MIERARISAEALGAIAMCCLVTPGCAGVKHAKPAEPVETAVPAEAIVVAEPPEMAAPAVIQPVPTAPPVAAAPRVAVAEAPASIPPAPKATGPRPPAIAAAPVPPVAPKATTVPTPPAVPKATTAPAPVATQPPPAPLDLASLGTRLKQTKAIGMFTKLSLKNQVDDLLEKFRAYHRQQGTATLPELRRSYDMLLLKVLSLLQDSDPPLARDIVQSRAAIWGILADPRKFNEASLMAGATT